MCVLLPLLDTHAYAHTHACMHAHAHTHAHMHAHAHTHTHTHAHTHTHTHMHAHTHTQIDLCGFKSYKEASIAAPFSPGINVVVGANGSGKSNFFHGACL